MAILNGRRVTNIPAAGVYGKDIIDEMRLKPGRRPVLQKRGGFEQILPNKRYDKQELIDRKTGQPLKASDIPDRNKGLEMHSDRELRDARGHIITVAGVPDRAKGSFGGRRDLLSKQIITEQVIDLAEHLFKGGVDFDEDDAHWFVAPKFILPRNWHHIARDTPLMIAFPTEYPNLPPIGFYMREDIPHAPDRQHFYEAAYHDAWKEPLAHGWKWYCVYVQPGMWRPATVQRPGDWKDGDNLWTYMTLINETLGSNE